jgi:hypothetical protein
MLGDDVRSLLGYGRAGRTPYVVPYKPYKVMLEVWVRKAYKLREL